MEKTEYHDFVAMLDAAEPLTAGAKRTKASDAMFFRLVSDMSLAEVAEAMQAHLRKSKFFPTPSDIRGAVDVSDQDRARLAWQLVVRAIERVGSYSSVHFDDPVIHFAIQAMGGWTRVCLPEQEIQWQERAFIQYYEIGLRRRVGWADVPEKLIGQLDGENMVQGFATQEVKAIGQGKRDIAIGRFVEPKQLMEGEPHENG